MKQVDFILGTMTFGESVFSPEAEKIVTAFLKEGYDKLDTAYVYNDGNSERILGEILPSVGKTCKIATKVNPRITGKLDADAAYFQVGESLKRLKLDCVDTVFLHFPDSVTPVEYVLQAMNDLYVQGKYKELGLSNYPAWMVADIWHICDKKGWVKPTIYEGIYNPLTRKAEVELNDALNHFGMRFYAYNPLSGGLLTGRYGSFEETPTEGRFTHRPNYVGRYWKESFFDALKVIDDASHKLGVTSVEAVYRWLAFHSMLNSERGDAIIIGVSKLDHLFQNMNAVKNGPLPGEMVEAFETAWAVSKKDSPEYFKLYR